MSVVTISSTLMSLFQGHVACWNFILTGAGWLALLLKGVLFYLVHLLYKKKYWFLNKYLFCPCLSLFRRIMWLLQSRMHLADTHLQFQKNITKYYIYVTFRCSQLITILQCIQCVLYYSTLTIILHMYSILYWLYYNTVDVFCHCCQC